MKKINSFGFGAMAVAVLLSGAALAAEGRTGTVYSGDGVAVAADGVSLAEIGNLLPLPDIAECGAWKVKNYSDLLFIEHGKTLHGLKSFYIGGPTSACDTAWNAVSPRIDLPKGGGKFIFSLKRMSDFYFISDSPSKLNREWFSCILWFDSARKPLKPSVCKIDSYPGGGYSQFFLTGDIPERAASVQIHLGTDGPNVPPGRMLALSEVKFGIIDGKCRKYMKSGSFESEVSKGGRVSWDADVPPGAEVKFQIAGADDPGSAVAAPFRGPDGTAGTFYTSPFMASAPYVRLRVVVKSDGKSTPVLRAVKIGGTLFDKWSRRCDSLIPCITRISASPTTDVNAPAVFEIHDRESFYLPETFRAKVDGREATSEFTRDGNRYTIKAPPGGWKEGLHEVVATVGDCRGNKGEAKGYFFIGKAPDVPKVTLRDDGMTLIDGKPFYPIGMFGVKNTMTGGWHLPTALADLKAAGFNTVQTYDRRLRDPLIEEAARQDMKVWMCLRKPDAKMIDFRRHNKSIIAWYIGDDTFTHETPQELASYDAAAKAIDPCRLTCQASGVWAGIQVPRFFDYVTGADVFLPEIYPVQGPAGKDGHLTCVADTICDMKAIKAGWRLHNDGKPRSCWAIIQNFRGWSYVWQVFPTREEVYGMTFAAICHGAHGVLWYTYGSSRDKFFKQYGENQGVTSHPERWRNMCDISSRVAELSPVLTERTPPQNFTVSVVSGPRKDPKGNDSVSVLVKRHRGRTYVITVNSSPEKVRAAFKVPGVPDEASVMWEKRRIRTENGAFADDFEPFGVHVYRFDGSKKATNR